MKIVNGRTNPAIAVDLHVHSTCSGDGELDVEALTSRLAAAGVAFASLTDHDTIAGQERFRALLAWHGIGFISGVEISASHEGTELHLLGYGFNLDNPRIRERFDPGENVQRPPLVAPAAAPPIGAKEAMDLIHEAGGIVVLAHPDVTEPDGTRLRQLVQALQSAGLDGLECHRPDILSPQKEVLLGLAQEYDLVVSGGSDVHQQSGQPAGVTVPLLDWKQFRDRMLAGQARDATAKTATAPVDGTGPGRQRIHWRLFALHIVLPAVATLLLVLSAFYFMLLPTLERAFLERKREMIRELTKAAIGILYDAYADEVAGRRSRAEAQAEAGKRIANMHYGSEGKDYFWLQDLTPRMIMHPYRPELNGEDLSTYADPSGVRIFTVFAKMAQQRKEGYVNYVWQWKDDPTRIEPKESYIRLFEPWGWIIGTGLYIQDVKSEITRLRNRVVLVFLAITALLFLILLYMIRESLALERQRSAAEAWLYESMARYRLLVESATEGSLILRRGRCVHTNPFMRELIGCGEQGLELLSVDDVFPDDGSNDGLYAAMRSFDSPTHDAHQGVTGMLKRRNQAQVPCAITIRSISDSADAGMILIVRQLEKVKPLPAAAGSSLAFSNVALLPSAAADNLAQALHAAASVEEVTNLCRKLPVLVKSLLENGASPSATAKMTSAVTDETVKSLMAMAVRAQGEPPVPFAFCALGSQGRQEQTLFTDQDNAIIYDPDPKVNEAVVREYFGKLATFVCGALNNAGYQECHGKAMAVNPRWCQPALAWETYFSHWIECADVHELMEFSIFFDLRPVAGTLALGARLRDQVFERLRHAPRFFPQVANNVLQFKPPLRLFGNIVSTGKVRESKGRVDLKAADMAIIGFARLYALSNGIREVNTLDRLDALAHKGILLESKRNDIVTAHEALTRLRLRHQLVIIEAGGQPDNLIDPGMLGHIEHAMLRECFSEIDLLQSRVGRDFLGG